MLKLQPFGNIVVYADMSGKELVDLTAVAQMKRTPAPIHGFANVSIAKRGKLTDLKIKGDLLIRLKPIAWRR